MIGEMYESSKCLDGKIPSRKGKYLLDTAKALGLAKPPLFVAHAAAVIA